MPRHFGHVDGIPIGATFANRIELSEANVHRPRQAGISGGRTEGADSIVVSGGYVDDVDQGDVIIYTGHGGNDPASHRQVADQDPDDTGNAALITSQRDGLPVRVVRGAGGDPPHAPTRGYRYDGTYQVVDHWVERGRDGFLIVRYRLEAIPGESARLSSQTAPSSPDTPSSGPAPTRPVTVQRRIRSSAVTEQVKRIHRHRCQVCGETLHLELGLYAEGAHIRGLGRPHEGPDVLGNVLCLCPNDHVRLDYGAIYLTDELAIIDTRTGQKIGQLRTDRRHKLELSHIAYHRSRRAAVVDPSLL